MTDQELFDKVTKHLLTQNTRATRKNVGCAYRSKDGKTCAAGCLIADEYYTPAIEAVSANGVSVRRALNASGVTSEQIPLVCALQNIHDNAQPLLWSAELDKLAQDHGLVFNP